MGGEQAARTMSSVTEAGMKRRGEVDHGRLATMEKKIQDHFAQQAGVLTTSAHLLDDAVIDPRTTREVLAEVLSICREADSRVTQPIQFGVARP
jgi:geranyl-CoA carboxylase beta subunit